MEDPDNANRGEQIKGFVQVNLQYVKKCIHSTSRAFHGLQNGLFSLFIYGQKSTAKSLI
jgi:hypothetical protein